MQGIVGVVCEGILDDWRHMKQFRDSIGKEQNKWKGFEGETVIVGGATGEKYKIANNDRFACIFDGYIANKKEMFELLTCEGYCLEQNNDAQMMLYAFIEWGEDCFTHIKGVFLTAIWDDEEKMLLLAVDQLGQKPIYYTHQDNVFLFAAHFNLLLQHCAVEPVLDGGCIAELIGMYPYHSPEFGMLKGVKKLRPGHYLCWSADGIKIRKYWSLETFSHKDNLPITAQRIRHLVKDAVASQLKGKESICSFLSGGVSSTANAVIAANYLAFLKGERIDTYSFDFKDNNKSFFKSTAYQNSDGKWAERVSKEFSTRHKHLVSSAQDVLNIFDGLCRLGSFLQHPIYESVFAEIYGILGKRSNLLLSGLGADVVFWDNDRKDLDWNGLLQEREALLTPEMAFYADTSNYFEKKYEKEMDKMPKLSEESEEEERRRLHAFFMFHWKLPQELSDHTALAEEKGISLRLPLCNACLAEYVWNIPYSMKTLGNRDKGILRLAMKGILPDDVIARKKRSCPMPYNQWLEDVLKERVEALLKDPREPISQFINQDAIESKPLTMAHTAYEMPKAELYAYFLQLNSWMEHYGIKIC